MKTAYIHCTLLDGSEDMIPQENMTKVEEEGKILEIEEISSRSPAIRSSISREILDARAYQSSRAPSGQRSAKEKEQDSKAAAKSGDEERPDKEGRTAHVRELCEDGTLVRRYYDPYGWGQAILTRSSATV